MKTPKGRDLSGIEAIERELNGHLDLLLAELQPEDGTEIDTAIYTVKSFCDVAIRLMKKSSPAQIREAARFVEIKARIDGIEVVRPAA